MIAQILSRSFLIKWLDKVQHELQSLVSETVARRLTAPPHLRLSPKSANPA